MAPALLSDELPVREDTANGKKTSYPQPLKLSGALAHFQREDTTPVIGTEFLNVNIVDDILKAPNSDELLRDLAITSLLPPYSITYPLSL